MVSALLWGGAPNSLLAAATEERLELYRSVALLTELTDVLSRGKFAPRLARASRTVATLIAQHTGLAETITAARIAPAVLADPDDDHVLACALAAGADLIVSGDMHLLSLKAIKVFPLSPLHQAAGSGRGKARSPATSKDGSWRCTGHSGRFVAGSCGSAEAAAFVGYTCSCIINRMTNKEKPLEWLGSSHRDLMALPIDVRRFFGYALSLAQADDQHDAVKVFKGFGGAGVLEVVEHDAGGTYRAVYTVKFEEAVFVLHCFRKKSKRGIATPKKDLDIIRARLKVAEALAKEQRNEKTAH